MNKFVTYIYSLFCYFLTAVVMIYFVGFYQNWLVPKQISNKEAIEQIELNEFDIDFENEEESKNSGISGIDVITNFLLIVLFGVQHSIMARDWFKKWWADIIPKRVERVTYLLFSSIILGIIIAFWQPIDVVLWNLNGSALAVFLRGLSVLGLVVVGVSVFSLSAADFSGFRQIQANEQESEKTPFQTPLFYKIVRHPIYFGFLLSFWATSLMTVGHLFFAILISAYAYIGAALEERNLVERFGLDYHIYQQEVPMLIPFLRFPF